MRGRAKHEPKSAGGRLLEWAQPMRSDSREESARPLSAKPAKRERPGRQKREQSEPRPEERPTRNVDNRPEHLVGKCLEVLGERLEEDAPSARIPSQGLASPARRSQQQGRRPIIERVRAGRRRFHEAQSVFREGETPEERRGERQRVDTRTMIVQETGKRQGEGPRTTTYLLGGLPHAHLPTGLSEHHAGSEAIRARSHHGGLERSHVVALL